MTKKMWWKEKSIRVDCDNMVTLKKHKHRHVSVAKSTRIDGGITVAMMFSTAA